MTQTSFKERRTYGELHIDLILLLSCFDFKVSLVVCVMQVRELKMLIW